MKHWVIIVLSLIAAAVVYSDGTDCSSHIIPARTDVCLSQDNRSGHVLSSPPMVAIPPLLLQIQGGGTTAQSPKLKNHIYDNTIYYKQQAQNTNTIGGFIGYTLSGHRSCPKVRAVDIYVYGQRKIVI